MQIGEMTERGTVQQETTAADGSGGLTSTWATLSNTPIWMQVHSIGGDEILRAGAVASNIRHIVTAWYRADVTPKMRILWTPTRSSSSAQRTLEILAVRPAKDPLFMELDCGELA